jgi:hypothetical protein
VQAHNSRIWSDSVDKATYFAKVTPLTDMELYIFPHYYFSPEGGFSIALFHKLMELRASKRALREWFLGTLFTATLNFQAIF